MFGSNSEGADSKVLILDFLLRDDSQLCDVEKAVDVLCIVAPEEDDLALGDQLCPDHHELDYIVEMPTRLEMMMFTYLLLCLSFYGFTSSSLN